MSAPHFFKHVRHLFVGSGPATLAAVLSMPPRERAYTVILEAAFDRLAICPGLKAKSCTSCEGTMCPVVNNVGGASAPYGNKLCFFPASEGVRKFSNNASLATFGNSKEFASIAPRYIARPSEVSEIALLRKRYHSDRLPMDEYRDLISSMVAEVRRHSTLKSGHPVKSVRRLPDGKFEVTGDFPGTYLAENVILATGRSGHTATRSLFDEIGIEYQEPRFDLGFRLEFDSSLLNEAFFYQEDIKYKKRYEMLGLGRTFCSCRDGAIVPVKYGEAFFADGALLKGPTGLSNFALMARSDKRIPVSVVTEWCARLNTLGKGTLRLMSIDLECSDPMELAQKIVTALPDGATPDHTAILRMLVKDIFSIAGGPIATGMADKSKEREIEVLGPAIDQYWPDPVLGDGFSTSVEGVWVIGDAASASRGIFQAIYSGACWAMRQFGSERAASKVDFDIVREFASAV